IEAPPLHFAEHAFPLHFLLQDPKSLIDVVIADEDLHRVVLRRLLRRIWADLGAEHTRAPHHPVECRCSDRPCPSWPRTADGDDPIWQYATRNTNMGAGRPNSQPFLTTFAG